MLNNCYTVATTKNGTLVTGLDGFSKQIPTDMIFEFHYEEADEPRQLKAGYELSNKEAIEVALRLSSAQ